MSKLVMPLSVVLIDLCLLVGSKLTFALNSINTQKSMELDGTSSWSSFILHSMHANGSITVTEFRNSTLLPLAAGASGNKISTDVSTVRFAIFGKFLEM